MSLIFRSVLHIVYHRGSYLVARGPRAAPGFRGSPVTAPETKARDESLHDGCADIGIVSIVPAGNYDDVIFVLASISYPDLFIYSDLAFFPASELRVSRGRISRAFVERGLSGLIKNREPAFE